MPVVVGWIISALVTAASSVVFRVLLALGIGYVTYTGVDLFMDGAETKIFSLLGGMSTVTQSLYGVLKIGQCIKVCFAALAMKVAMAGLTNGSITKMVQKPVG